MKLFFPDKYIINIMFSIVITNALLTTTESMVRNAFEQLELGAFNLHMVQGVSKGRDCLKIYINFTSITDKGSVMYGRLMENDSAQKNGQKFSPISIIYDTYRGRDKYWQVYLTKTPEQRAERMEEFKVRVEM